MVERIPSIKISNGPWIGCVTGKHPEWSYEKGRARRDNQVLVLVHSDLIGPLPTPSYGGSKYVLTFIDDFSRFCWVYFLKLKSKFFETLKVFGKPWLRISVGIRSNSLGLIMENIMWIRFCSSSMRNVESRCSIRSPTHHNRMVCQSTRTWNSRRWQPVCLKPRI